MTRISICDRRTSGWYFGSAGRVTFSDGSTVNWTGLPNDCGSTGANPLVVTFPRKTGITWFRVIGDSGGIGNAGLAEVEAFDDGAPAPDAGWSFSYFARLAINPDGSRTLVAEDGAQMLYKPNGAGGYIRPAGARSLLAPFGAGYELTRHDHVRYRFDSTGLLTAMLDRNGNQLAGADSCAVNKELVVECYGADRMPYGSAITIGNIVSTSYSLQDYGREPGLREHENAHATQWTISGFPLRYLRGAIWSQLTTNDLFCGNPFERAAGPTSGYAHCGWGRSGGSGK
jgi:hypothetical protein